MRNPLAVLALALVAGTLPVWSQKAPIRFKVVNATPDEIRAIYVCPTGSPTWGANLLTRGPLAPGKRVILHLSGECGLYDMRLVAPGGKEYMEEELSFCEDDDVVNLAGRELKKVKPSAGR